MHVAAWEATDADLDALVALYRVMEVEQVGLKPMWRLADALAEPVEASLKDAVADDASYVYLGGIDGVPFGFCIAGSEELLPQAEGEQVGVIRYIFTHPEARGVGIAEAMLTDALAQLRALGLTKFDVRVLPGHRNAKNFFEANGFSARLIVMFHDDAGDAPDDGGT